MRTLLVKEEYIKVTESFIGGIILKYLVDIKEENKVSKYFNINLKALKEVTMLDLSEATIRREIKKLIKLGFIIVQKNKKVHSYAIDEEKLKKAFIKIGAIEEVDEFLAEEEVASYDGNLYKQVNIMDIKKVREESHEPDTIKDIDKILRYHDTTIEINCQEKILKNYKLLENNSKFLKKQLDYETFVTNNKNKDHAKMFDNIYRIMLEVLMSDAKTIRINKTKIHSGVVHSVFKKVNGSIIESVIFKLKRLNTKVKNFKNYIITTVYNTYLEGEFTLQNELYINEGILI